MTETRMKNVGLERQQAEDYIKSFGMGGLFKLRDSVGLLIALWGHGDITLSELADITQRELDVRHSYLNPKP